MPINMKNYELVQPTIYRHKKEVNKFLFRFRIKDKYKRLTFNIDKRTGWNKRQYLEEAKIKKYELYNVFKEEIKGKKIKSFMKLDELSQMFFDTQPNTKWNSKKQSFYNTNIKEILGSKPINEIFSYDIEKIMQDLVKQGKEPRTAKQVTDILNPMFTMGKRNNNFLSNPCENVNFVYKKKKRFVINATDKFISLHKAINEIYKNDPFYKTLFLLGFMGRRKDEILSLKWEDIDFQNNAIWLTKTKNGNPYKIKLPNRIKELLLQIPSYMKIRCEYTYKQEGIVFANFTTGKKITHVERHYPKIREASNIPEWNLHYCRHILVSMLNEQGADNSTLSGNLLHNSTQMLNTYLSNNSYEATNKADNLIIDILEDSKSDEMFKLELKEMQGEMDK